MYCAADWLISQSTDCQPQPWTAQGLKPDWDCPGPSPTTSLLSGWVHVWNLLGPGGSPGPGTEAICTQSAGSVWEQLYHGAFGIRGIFCFISNFVPPTMHIWNSRRHDGWDGAENFSNPNHVNVLTFARGPGIHIFLHNMPATVNPKQNA